MTPTKQHLRILVLLLICSYFAHTAAKHDTPGAPCLRDQASSLLQLKRSFIDANLSSWRAGTDCCHWEGVTCDMAFGRVISLDLGEFHLDGRRLDPALFNLTSLRNLSLAFNDFGEARLPESGFERLTDIIHLNFACTNFLGKIPIGIARLKNLVTLDFSGNNELYFQEPSFQTFMANLSNLRELHLDEVGIPNVGSTWSIALADSVPQLQILSLSGCSISGSIHPSFSKLRSLSILDISGNYLEGQFPTKIFQLKSLRTLDLSENPSLSVCLQDFPVGNNLETLNLAQISNFSCDMPSSLGNLKTLKNLGLSTKGTPKELPFLIGKLPSLTELQLYGSGLEKPVLSWVGKLKRLTNLELDYYDFSQSIPSWIGNLTSLASLEFWSCDFSGQRIPSWIGNLTKLASLRIKECNISGQSPKFLFALPALQSLYLGSNQLSGSLEEIPIPLSSPLSTIDLSYNQLTGPIPKSFFQLKHLEYLDLASNHLSGSLEEIPAPLSSPLWIIYLDHNQLTGPIPKSFFQLKHLEYLDLAANRLSGELSSFWRLKSLSFLSLSNNLLSILDEEGDNVYLVSGNLTKLPGALKYLDTVSRVDLSSNQINGVIPSWIWENWKDNLNSLNLSCNMFTTLENISFSCLYAIFNCS